jgi:hypothetical protein
MFLKRKTMVKPNPKTIKALERKIAAGREKLYKIYTAHGCTDDTVLDCSVMLDQLIMQYQQLTANGKVGQSRSDDQ